MRWGGELIVTMCSADQSVVHRWRQQFDVLWHRDVVTGRHGRRPPARRQWSRSTPDTDVRCWASTAERPLRRRRRLSAADRRRLPRPAGHHRTLRRRSSVFTTRSSRSPGKWHWAVKLIPLYFERNSIRNNTNGQLKCEWRNCLGIVSVNNLVTEIISMKFHFATILVLVYIFSFEFWVCFPFDLTVMISITFMSWSWIRISWL